MDLAADHLGFVAAAYAVVVLGLAGFAVWLTVRRRALMRRIAELEARGVRRRARVPEGES